MSSYCHNSMIDYATYKNLEKKNMEIKIPEKIYHKDNNNKRHLVWFYNDHTRVKREASGYRCFEVGVIGYKWVKIRNSILYSHKDNHWRKIRRSTWDNIVNGNSFKLIEEQV